MTPARQTAAGAADPQRALGAADAPAAAAIAATVGALRRAQRSLQARPRHARIDALAAVTEDWLRPDSPWMARAIATLPDATGFSAPMVAHAMPAMLAPLRAASLARLVDEQAHGSAPPVILHILPGNLPGLAAIPTALSLAIGSAALLKPGRGDRVFPDLYLAALAAHDPELAAAAAVQYWPGGAGACEDAALAAADLVVASGDDTTIAALRARCRGRFIGHGHRISFAVIDAGAADTGAAAALALDVATWDQRGCLSPQVCFVAGDLDAARAFGAQVAAALAPLAARLPPAIMTLGERLAVRRWREEAEWATFGGEPYAVFAADDEAAGTVVVEPQAALRPSPLARTLRVAPVAGLEEVVALLAPARAVLEGCGLAASEARWDALAAQLRAAGVHLVSRLGTMQVPPLDWPQGGRPRLADWCGGGDGT